jgi:lipid-A-disaccharide synthase
MKVGLVAGEASGDALGATLITALQSHDPAVLFEGIAGPKMMALGAQSFHPMEALAVRGLGEVLHALPRLLMIRRQLANHFLQNKPDLFVGIDAPDFNLGLEKGLKQAGIPTVQMVAPTAWAWRANRIPGIRESVSRLLCIFPFEKPFFEQHGIPTTYIGHPLIGQIPAEGKRQIARENLALSPDEKVLALLPGSRVSELEYHANLFVETAQDLVKRHGSLRFLVPLVNQATQSVFEQALKNSPIKDCFTLTQGNAHEVVSAADLALVASGTATLETALLGCPMVVTYRISKLTAWWVSQSRTFRFVALPNIILDREVVPERLQEQATAQELSHCLGALLENPAACEEMRRSYREIRQVLSIDTQAALWQGVEATLHG